MKRLKITSKSAYQKKIPSRNTYFVLFIEIVLERQIFVLLNLSMPIFLVKTFMIDNNTFFYFPPTEKIWKMAHFCYLIRKNYETYNNERKEKVFASNSKFQIKKIQ